MRFGTGTGDRMGESLKTSIRPNPNGNWPQVDPTAYIDPTARIIGNVHIGPAVFVGPNAVIRADETDSKGQVQPIRIEAKCNVQDGVIIHALGGTGVTVGSRTSLAHGCIIHGPCTLGQGCFIGFRAVVYKAELGDGTFVGAGGIVQGVDLAANALVGPGTVVLSEEDAMKLVDTTGQAERAFAEKVVNANLALAKGNLRPDMQGKE